MNTIYKTGTRNDWFKEKLATLLDESTPIKSVVRDNPKKAPFSFLNHPSSKAVCFWPTITIWAVLLSFCFLL